MVCPMWGHEIVFVSSLLALVLCIAFRETLYLLLSLPA